MSATTSRSPAGEEEKKARNRLVEQHLHLVKFIANRFQGEELGDLDLDDLVQEGYTGLIRAAELFDPEKINPDTGRSYQFSSYATWWIREKILRALREQRRAIRLPDHVWDDLNQLARERKALWEQYQRAPTVDELAEAMQVQRSHVLFLIAAQQEVASLDEFRSAHLAHGEGEEDHLLDSLAAPDSAMQLEQEAEVAGLLKYLSREERSVIVYRYQIDADAEYGVEDIPLPFTVVARRLGMTAEHAKTVEARALLKMHYWAERPHFPKG